MTAQEFFKNDLFAENAGVVLLEVRKGYSKAKLEIKPLVHYYFPTCQRPRRYSLCRSTRTLYRPKHGLLSGRCNESERRFDCHF